MAIRKDVDELIAFLYSAAKLDPAGIGKLLAARVPCNAALAEHPSIQVSGHGPEPPNNAIPEGEYRVGFVGLLNGYAGTLDSGPREGWGPITAIVEEDGTVSRFERTRED